MYFRRLASVRHIDQRQPPPQSKAAIRLPLEMGTEHSFLANLEWRRAVKRFDDGPVDTTQIIRAMINAPSSFGLQP